MRYNGMFGSSLVVDAAFTMNWNQFYESPRQYPRNSGFYAVRRLSWGQRRPRAERSVPRPGVRSFWKLMTRIPKGIQFDVHKEFSFMGQHHTISVGYNWQFPTYKDTTSYTGGNFAIPTVNETGGSYLSTSIAPKVAGQSAEVLLYLELVPTADQASLHAVPLYERARVFDPPASLPGPGPGPLQWFHQQQLHKNHAAYINDDWEMSKYATLEAGLAVGTTANDVRWRLPTHQRSMGSANWLYRGSERRPQIENLCELRPIRLDHAIGRGDP